MGVDRDDAVGVRELDDAPVARLHPAHEDDASRRRPHRRPALGLDVDPAMPGAPPPAERGRHRTLGRPGERQAHLVEVRDGEDQAGRRTRPGRRRRTRHRWRGRALRRCARLAHGWPRRRRGDHQALAWRQGGVGTSQLIRRHERADRGAVALGEADQRVAARDLVHPGRRRHVGARERRRREHREPEGGGATRAAHGSNSV